MPLDDNQYNVDKDIIDEKLVSIDGDDDDNIEGQGDNLGVQEDEGERSIEEVFQPL